MKFVSLVGATRYLVLIPIVGLVIAAAAMFFLGGIGLIAFVIHSIQAGVGQEGQVLPIFDLLEYVHQFLIGTVLYITAMGLFQLFIKAVPVPDWLRTESSEDLENNLIGVTVVVLAIEFLGYVFSGKEGSLLQYGTGIALPIAALALFMGAKRLHRSGNSSRAPRGDSLHETPLD